MPIQTTANIWHNGKLIPWEKAQVHVMSHVLHYGYVVPSASLMMVPGAVDRVGGMLIPALCSRLTI